MCNCYSINADKGADKQVELDPNPYFKCDSKSKKVYVDSCISHVIKHLWKNGVWTRNCCCGHNGNFFEKVDDIPSIIFENKLSKEKADKIRKLIKEVDNREFKILSWTLTEV